MTYHLSKKVLYGFEEALSKVAEEIKKEGFGIITEIDMQETLKKKLNVDWRKYKILGVCNPKFAYQALQLEDKIGTMLPCNIVVQEHANGSVEVSAINPVVSMKAIGNNELHKLASEVQIALKKVIDSL